MAEATKRLSRSANEALDRATNGQALTNYPAIFEGFMAKGVPEATVLWKHTLRNSMIPVLTVIGIQLGQLMAGSIILESVFSLPGIGRLALGAITARDLPVVQGVGLFVASVIVMINVAVDILYGVLDPRIRHE